MLTVEADDDVAAVSAGAFCDRATEFRPGASGMQLGSALLKPILTSCGLLASDAVCSNSTSDGYASPSSVEPELDLAPRAPLGADRDALQQLLLQRFSS